MKVAADKRFASLEEVIHALQRQCEEAEANADAWRCEALRPGNKRGSITVGPTPTTQARVRPRVTPLASPVVRLVDNQLKGIVDRHKEEVELLKEMRLKEVKARKDSEEEVERLKEALAKMEMEGRPKTRGTNLRSRLDDAAGQPRRACNGAVDEIVLPTARKDKGKTPVATGDRRDVFLCETRKDLRNKKKDEVRVICEKEGVDYTTLDCTKEAIAQIRLARAFGGNDGPAKGGGVSLHEVSDDGEGSSDKGDEVDSAVS
ncbi:hypothetical protein CBR_g32068 [Chara braunii]|uniref:Uncharacterized protein n=1 Tax=Chara braunii TaxID=69332 RepID=A0A388LGG0_CHABU|nr:hypothetical protein CBR_g32068 [Chara braunii]|eukprot:GBG81394.1 hypothetical protein CBR_g32068 [Chara braunii]